MALEIEHKYLTCNSLYREMSISRKHLCQGYLSRDKDCVVRVRIADDEGFLTVKGRNHAAEGGDDALREVRSEFEYPVPAADARQMLAMCKGRVIEKTRYIVPYEGKVWEVDEFHGELEGLTVAEVELSAPGESYPLPPFAGEEVTGDERYYNSNL